MLTTSRSKAVVVDRVSTPMRARRNVATPAWIMIRE
jgi:hypothetical protein